MFEVIILRCKVELIVDLEYIIRVLRCMEFTIPTPQKIKKSSHLLMCMQV